MNPWNFLWIGILAAELFTILTSFIASHIFWGRLSQEVIIIGIVDSLVASFIVVFATIFFINKRGFNS